MHDPIVEVLMSAYCCTSRCPPHANKLKKHNTMMAGLRCCSKSANTVSISLDEPVFDYEGLDEQVAQAPSELSALGERLTR